MRILYILLMLPFCGGLFSQTVSPDIKVIHASELKDTQVTHVVKPGETLFRIAKSYSVSVDEIMKWNHLKSDEIENGQQLVVGFIKKDPTENLISPEILVDTFETGTPFIVDEKIPDTLAELRLDPPHKEPFIENITSLPDAVKNLPKEYTALPLTGSIILDGIPDEEAWKNANVAGQFVQRDPVEGASVSQQTEVKILYSSNAIYVAAIMYDTHPDSILHQLGNRDEGPNLNSDAFRFGLDPYNIRNAGYVFEVSASGVQSESYNDDFTFDAVWMSRINRNDKGWTVEMKIPYSAIRFPPNSEQTWAIQFARSIRRNREYDQWSLTPKNVQNGMLYWGTMKGIKNVNPPLRLSVTPYVTMYMEQAGYKGEDGKNKYENSYSYSGGADIKYGINESFTIDMTLMPDFSQVQSDNNVKNLSAYEVYFNELRPFFKEGTELFSKGDLLYTRRIGRIPSGFYSVDSELKEGETIEENPDKAKLVNAVKLSGRTENRLGIGLLNAVTDNTYAIVKGADGSRRKILTEPLSNYNLIILDQQLKNNSSISLVNTNVSRNAQARDANVTLLQGRFENSRHQYQIRGMYSESHIFEWENDESGPTYKKHTRGHNMNAGIDKISGVSWYGMAYGQNSNKYDKNDMGYLSANDFSEANFYYSYNKFNPFWKHFRQGSLTLFANRTGRPSDNNHLQRFQGGLNFFLLFNSNWSVYTEAGTVPIKGRDYNEPRIPGKFFITPQAISGSLNFTTNYNKPLAFDFGANLYTAPQWNYTGTYYYLVPMVRLSDKFNFKLTSTLNIDDSDIGFAYTNAGYDTSYFGRRDVITFTNAFTSRYIFKNDMSLSFTTRHYWSKGVYKQFYRLEDSGELNRLEVTDEHIHDYDFNSNYLTVDVVYNWQFAPGSSFIVTYKNLVLSDTQENITGYFENLKNTFREPQTNSVSLKILYFLDYEYLKGKTD